MYRIIKRRGFFFFFSLLLSGPGFIFFICSLWSKGTALPLSIDYTGGTLWEMRFKQAVHPADVRQVFVAAGFADTSAFTIQDDRTVQVKFKNIGAEEKATLKNKLMQKFGAFEEQSY